MLKHLFGSRPRRDLGAHLYAQAVEQARSPAYTPSKGRAVNPVPLKRERNPYRSRA